jgi:nicotinamide mononucleotide (NMN) deamidase PncC
VGVSITGIAGPGGGSPAKPVGLVWIGIESAWGGACHRFVGSGDRLQNKSEFVDQALINILAHLESL